MHRRNGFCQKQRRSGWLLRD